MSNVVLFPRQQATPTDGANNSGSNNNNSNGPTSSPLLFSLPWVSVSSSQTYGLSLVLSTASDTTAVARPRLLQMASQSI